MKKLFVLISILVSVATLFAQNNNFSYQAVVRDNNNHLVENQMVGVKLSLIRDVPNGVGDYIETHTVQTNANGLMTLMIGNGTIVSGSLANLDWSNHTYYLKSEVDPTGGTNYTITGVQVVAAVPFAQYAVSGNYTETQVLSISNDTIFLTGGTNSFVKLPIPNVHVPDSISSYINDVGYITSDSIPVNVSHFNNDAGYITSYADSQQISMSGDTLKLERGGCVLLTPSCCALVDSLKETVDSLNQGIDSLNNVIAILESIICKPTVLTNNATAIYIDTAVCGGNATSPCGHAVSARGVCWNTTGSATLSDNHTSDGTGTGNFTSVLTGLTMNTTYYVRAYLVSENDTVYGNEVTFSIHGALPVVTTTAASSVTNSTAVSGGNVTSDGGSSIIKRGVCWSTSHNPTVADSHTSDSVGLGAFASNITGLNPQTTYYVRAYAMNSADTAYGNEETFVTPDVCDGDLTVTDIDGNEYEIVIIGSQCWMRENMRATRQPDGGWISDGYYEYCYPTSEWYDECVYYEQVCVYEEDVCDDGEDVCVYEEEVCDDGEDVCDEDDGNGNCLSSHWECYSSHLECMSWEWECYSSHPECMSWEDVCMYSVPVEYPGPEECYDAWHFYSWNDDGSCYCNEAFYAYPNYNDYDASTTYGLLYNWPAAMNGTSTEGAQGICPDGWHIPTQAEYNTLIAYVSSTSSCSNTATYTAKALASQSNWYNGGTSCAIGDDLNSNNASGFSAEPAGDYSGGLGEFVNYWLSTESKGYYPYYFRLYYSNEYVDEGTTNRDSYNSVRCIKD